MSPILRWCLALALCLTAARQQMAIGASTSRPMVHSWASSCGAVCLRTVVLLYGRKAGLAEIRGILGTDKRGETSLNEIQAAANRLGFSAVGVHVGWRRLEDLKLPVIVHQPPEHFVVMVGLGAGKGAVLIDPPRKSVRVSSDDLRARRSFRGVAISSSVTDFPAQTRGFRSFVAVLLTGLLVVCSLAYVVKYIWLASLRRQRSGPGFQLARQCLRARPLSVRWAAVMLVIGCICVLVVSGWVRYRRGPHTITGVQFERPVWTFGVAEEGEQLRNPFAFINRSRCHVTVESVRPSCSCLTATASRRTIGPGARAQIHTVFNTNGRFGYTDLQVFVKVRDAHGRRDVFALRISGKIRAQERMITVPQVVRFGEVVSGTSQRRRIALRRQGDAPIGLFLSISSPLSFVKAIPLSEARQNPFEREIEVVLSSDAPIDAFEGALTVQTNHPKYPSAVVPIRGRIVRDLEVLPEPAFLGIVCEGRPILRKLIVRSRTGRRFEMDQVVCDVPGLIPAVVEVERGGSTWHLGFSTSESLNQGLLKGQITIHTDLPGAREVSIPIIAAAK